MLQQGVICLYLSPWAAVVVMVPFPQKKDGFSSFCIDYRCLNNQTNKDMHPLLCIDNMLEASRGLTWFLVLHAGSESGVLADPNVSGC